MKQDAGRREREELPEKCNPLAEVPGLPLGGMMKTQLRLFFRKTVG